MTIFCGFLGWFGSARPLSPRIWRKQSPKESLPDPFLGSSARTLCTLVGVKTSFVAYWALFRAKYEQKWYIYFWETDQVIAELSATVHELFNLLPAIDDIVTTPYWRSKGLRNVLRQWLKTFFLRLIGYFQFPSNTMDSWLLSCSGALNFLVLLLHWFRLIWSSKGGIVTVFHSNRTVSSF